MKKGLVLDNDWWEKKIEYGKGISKKKFYGRE